MLQTSNHIFEGWSELSSERAQTSNQIRSPFYTG